MSDGKATITNYTGSATELTIPSTLGGCPVTVIGSEAFFRYTSLTSITLPAGVTSIGSYAFYTCTSLTSITLPDSVVSIGQSAFTDTALYNSQADGVFYVDGWACGCKGTMPDSTALVLPEGTVGIADSAFSHRSALISVTIPASLTSIGYEAFYNCSKLTAVTVPASVTSIGSYAFAECDTLVEFYLAGGDLSLTLGSNVLKNSPAESTFGISPEGLVVIGETVIGYRGSAASLTVPATVTVNGIETNITSIAGGFAGNTTLTTVDLSAAIYLETIDSRAFAGCTALTALTLAGGISSIGSRAFEGCTALTALTIPTGVTTLGYRAFAGSGLTTVNSDTAGTAVFGANFTDIGVEAFAGCTGIVNLHINVSSLQSIGPEPSGTAPACSTSISTAPRRCWPASAPAPASRPSV